MKLTPTCAAVALALTTSLLAPTAQADGCVPGAQTECACANGKRSIQVCAASGDRLEPCQCGQSPPPAPPAPADPAPSSDPPPPDADAEPPLPEPTEPAEPVPAPREVAIDPRGFTAWGQIPTYQPGDEDDDVDHEMNKTMVATGGALLGAGALALVVGGVLYSLVPRRLACRSDACGAHPDDGSQLPPSILFGVGAASLLTGAILLPIGLAPLFRAKQAAEPPPSAARFIPSRVAVSLMGGEVQWTF